MKRDILNHLGEKVGELELPDDTPESVWQKRLSAYSMNPDPLIPDVTPRQFKQALVYKGIPDGTIEAVIATLPEPDKSLARIEWEYSLAFKRNNPLVIRMAPALGFDSAALDELWLFAGTL